VTEMLQISKKNTEVRVLSDVCLVLTLVKDIS
jgi:hypothetical protein